MGVVQKKPQMAVKPQKQWKTRERRFKEKEHRPGYLIGGETQQNFEAFSKMEKLYYQVSEAGRESAERLEFILQSQTQSEGSERNERRD
ncbi:hypothetical protein FF1_043369 [Malus domestica]